MSFFCFFYNGIIYLARIKFISPLFTFINQYSSTWKGASYLAFS